MTPSERVSELREKRQRAQARRWQTERLRELMARIERDGFKEATQARIDTVFKDRSRPPQS